MTCFRTLELALHQPECLAGRKDSFATLVKSALEYGIYVKISILTTAPDMIADQSDICFVVDQNTK
jgi:hypothetical protein